jgi:L-ascorbate metabolism protein UlaG (beta-lactamase superfamily)
MEVSWYGYNCFGVKTKGGSLLVDPYKSDIGLALPNLKANVVVLSNEEEKSNNAEAVGDEPKVLTWPGEYEVAGIAITALEISAALVEGQKGPTAKSMVYSFDADGLKVCYISNFTVPLTEELMESIGDVDILVAPVGKGNLEEIHKVIEEIEPRVVIPVGYKTGGLKLEAGDLESFMKKTGAPISTPREKFTVSTRSELPQEKTEFVVLSPQNA